MGSEYKPTFKITFDSNGGNEVNDKDVVFNEEYGELPTPTKEGSVFLGWYDENNNKIESSTILKDMKSMKLHAKWASSSYNINMIYRYEDKEDKSVIPINYGETKETLIELESDYYISEASCTNGYTITNLKTNDLNTSSQTININNNNVINNSECTFKIKSKIYKEAILKGTDPVIKENLIPVTIENDGTVKKADVNTEWYDYETKKWANAVILEDKTKTYTSGQTIPLSNIESYFVWIPKYKYKLWNVESKTNSTNKGKHSIEIEFGTDNTTDINGTSCKTPMTSGGIDQCNNGEWMTHPAFISLGVNGIWVGKFETTGSTSDITVKPGEVSLKNLNVKTMFDTAYNYKRNLESHMMKNTEWGAIAYLSHSKYGKGLEVNINNNSNYLTGYSAIAGTDQSSYPGESGTDVSKTLPYNTETGYKASTTGNISGVYDMSGGAYEYMASHMSGKIGLSGFSDVTNPLYAKYIDVYSSSSEDQKYEHRILGDATGEMGPFSTYKDGDGDSRHHNGWYADNSLFVASSNPWLFRGGDYDDGGLAGQFYFNRTAGASHGLVGFRLVLA